MNGLTRLNYAFDPSNFLLTRTYGEVPTNTTLTFTYLSGGGISSNVPSNRIESITYLNFTKIKDESLLTPALMDFIINSVSCY
jgi:hypothetical protein